MFEIAVIESQRELDALILEEDSHEENENIRGDRKPKGSKCQAMEANTVPPKYRGINAKHQERVQTHEES